LVCLRRREQTSRPISDLDPPLAVSLLDARKAGGTGLRPPQPCQAMDALSTRKSIHFVFDSDGFKGHKISGVGLGRRGGSFSDLSDHYYSINLETRKRARFGNAPEIETDPQIRLPQKRRLEASKSPARSLRKVIVLPLGSKKKRYGVQLWLYARSFLSNEPR